MPVGRRRRHCWLSAMCRLTVVRLAGAPRCDSEVKPVGVIYHRLDAVIHGVLLVVGGRFMG